MTRRTEGLGADSRPGPAPARGVSRSPYVPSGFFAWRTPLLPCDDLHAWSSGLTAAAALAAGEDPGEALALDRAVLRVRLREKLRDPVVREALFVASPSLSARLVEWERAPDTERGTSVERPLVRYFERMSLRPTPFGLFAGCSFGRVGAATRLELSGRTHYRRHTRLDMHYLSALGESLRRAPELFLSLRVRPGSSLYAAGAKLRYVEARTEPATRERTHHLVSVDPTPYLEDTLERARPGVPARELVANLVARGAPLEDASEYVGALIDAQVLVPDFEPAVTGPEPLHELARALREMPGGAPYVAPLERVHGALAEMDAEGLGVTPERYRDVARALEELPCEIELPRLFQVDLVKPGLDATLGENVVAEVARGVEVLRRASRPTAPMALARFRDAFVRRYEEREVPLVEALDPESGVGFGEDDEILGETSPLLAGLDLGPGRAGRDATVSWGPRESVLLGRVTDALARGERVIELREHDLDAIESADAPPLPDAFAAVATLAAASDAAVTAGDYKVWLQGTSGPSGAVLLGRFCHADPVLREAVEAHLRAEEALRPDAVFAEVVHLPQGRMGNVLLRPVLRGHEIAYVGRSGAPDASVIPVTDLRVRVIGGRVELRSEALGREVVPRLTSAHNFVAGDLATYRFLCMLQHQGVANPGWDWGALDAAPFLPRVTHGRLVLALARWRLSRDDLAPLDAARDSRVFEAARALKQRLGLPRWVLLADGDNTLPVDLDNVLSVEAFAQAARGRETVTLTEVFPEDGGLRARGPEGRFAHEVVVPFVRRTSIHAAGQVCRAPRVDFSSEAIARSFPPGSEWLFARIYTGAATADDVLRAVVRPVVDEAIGSGAADSWFFIRYGDPDWHLRLRLHGDPARLCREVIPNLHNVVAPRLHDGAVWRLDLGTYEREIERYGGPVGMLLSESLFCADSVTALTVIEELRGDAGADARWRLALCGADALMDDLGLGLDVRRRLLAQSRDALARELEVSTASERRLDLKYRDERASLEALLDPRRELAGPMASGVRALRTRSVALAPVTAALREAGARGRLSSALESLASSYLHMHVNRLLRSAARAQEMVVYDFLGRLYGSRAARGR